jgi:Common central domain of tyrosinase
MMTGVSRRAFAAGGVAVLTAAAFDQRATGQPAPARLRKNIDTLSNDELAAYEHAISIVKKKSDANASDPEGYLYWANLHDDFNTPHSGCPHMSEKFFPWHRQHLFDFETVLRKSDPPTTANVTLPYWDWSQPPKDGVHFPKAFENSASPLFVTRRNRTPPPWDAADLKALVADSDWSAFAGKPDASDGFGQNPGSVEFGPHNTLHGNISRLMGSADTAVLDPIFWSFHAYIDLVWTRWQRLFVTDQKPQPFVDGAAVIWFLERSFPISVTAKTSDYGYAYDYDYSIDGPPPAPAVAVAGGILSPARNVAALAAVAQAPRAASFRTDTKVGPASKSVIHLTGLRVFRDKTYAVDIYLHPPRVDVASISAEARRPFLVRKVTLWRSPHHEQTAEVFVRLDPAQVGKLNDGWIVTMTTEANVGDDEIHEMAMAAPSANFALPSTSALVGGIEIQER